MTRRRRLLAAAALVVVAAGVALGWALTRASGPTLQAVGSGADGAQAPHSRPGVAYVFLMRVLCTSGAPITISRVTAADPTGGVTVESWGVRREFAGDGYDNRVAFSGPVSQMRGFGHHPVTVRCTPNPNPKAVDDFAISISMTANRGTMSGVWVYYRSGGETRRAFAQYAIALCVSADCPEPPIK